MYKFSCLKAINPHYLREIKKDVSFSFTNECGTFPLNRLSGAIVLVSPQKCANIS